MSRTTLPHPFHGAFFDFGSVLVKVDLARFKERLGAQTGCHTQQIDGAIFESGLKSEFDRGLITREEFCSRVVKGLNTDLSPGVFKELWSDMFTEIPPAVEMLLTIHRQMPVYGATNIDPLHLDRLHTQFPWMKLFKGIAASCEMGVCKPDPRFLTQATEQFGLTPARCLFIDDRADNVDSGTRLGLTSIHAPDHHTMEAALQKLNLL